MTQPIGAKRVGIPQDTIVRQRRASAPDSSAWVSANAGSGKTHVLAQRVVRLLLSGVPPGRILCLTFTKAGAATMSNRVFKDLAAWTALDDATLTDAIVNTGAPPPSATDLEFARQLFARAVETPGGLKIQTIHAFCERLLHLFPFEANVPARFEVLEDLAGTDLLLRARETALAEALADPQSGPAEAVAILAARTTSDSFDQLLREALGHREVIRSAVRNATGLAELTRQLRQRLGLDTDEDAARIEQAMTDDGLPAEQWEDIARRIGADGTRSDKTGNRLQLAAQSARGERCDLYLDVFLTEKLAPRANVYLPKPIRRTETALCETLDRERDRLVGLANRRKAARVAEGTAALSVMAALILDHYDRAKRRRGLLDYEDLIERTRTLLVRSDAAWVLYKLDRGIDHILIDEAQDTSPAQWEILEAISADFFAGQGGTAGRRTFFAVGDEKQSIYSFQGARPDMFATMRSRFARRAGEAEHSFAEIQLLLSFRSAKAVLETVDQVFRHPAHAAGLTADPGGPPPHEALKRLPGLVELWPPIIAAPAEEPRDWRLPVDAADPNEPPVILARRIAEAIGRWTAPASGETVADDAVRRPMRPGDILILVRSRNAFFDAMIRALKERHVPVAGADRLALTDHIAVMDLIAAGWTALSPGDDYTLACVLKSPLIGLDDDDLIALAPRRKGSLLTELERSQTPPHRQAAASLAEWRRRAASLTPFGFYTRLLSSDGGRRALLGRLGPEAGDAVDEFLALTLAHEREGAPSLLAFLARLDGADLSVKRDLAAAGDAVRVMTVHASKGLEAKVVILPDTCSVPNGTHDPKLFGIEDLLGDASSGSLLWSPKMDADPAQLATAREAVRRRAREEYNRLFYVALTRAEERLYIAGHCGEGGLPDGCWYRMIEAADLPLEEAPAFWNPEERVRRRHDAAGAEPTGAEPPGAPGSAAAIPGWLSRSPEPEPSGAEPPIRPSNPLGAADQFAPVAWSFGDRHRSDRQDALATGQLMHRLLQHLPAVQAERRRNVGHRVLEAQGRRLAADQRARLLDQALAVIEDPALAALFGPGSRAEVSVAGTIRLASGRRVDIAGQMDRIGVTDDVVHLADYKTGRAAVEPTTQHLLQLALYRAALAQLYPAKRIRAYLVWTADPRIVEIDADRLEQALNAAL